MVLGKYLKVFGGPTTMEKVFFRVNHPIFPTLLFSGTAFLFIWIAQSNFHFPIWGLLGALVVGVFIWTLIEYSLHRFVFHWTNIKEPWRTLFSGLHMAHHRDTEDPGLIIAPPTVALVDSVFIFGILWGLTWHWGVALILLAGVNVGYIFYEWVHYGSHQYKWKRGLFAYSRRYHLYHHFKRPQELYGVTFPLWDHVFSTPKSVTSPKNA